MSSQISIIHLITQASVLVQVVMAMLMLASIVSWAVILSKRQLLSKTRSASEKFEERFWSGGNLADLYDSVTRNRENDGLAPIFVSGFEEYKRQQDSAHADTDPDDSIAAVHRQMRVSQVREVDRLEGGLALLATIGSTSPYVGLFGTVWGIMNAFIGISNMKQASLAVVAPGIAEALIATAMGLFAAIPAVIAYNFFTRSVENLETQYHTFSEEMVGIIERGLRGRKS